MAKNTVPAEAKKEWLKGRDNHAGILARNVTLELEGEESPRMILAYRIWEKDQKTGLQLTNRQDGYPERWQWFANNRIVSLTAEPANVPETLPVSKVLEGTVVSLGHALSMFFDKLTCQEVMSGPGPHDEKYSFCDTPASYLVMFVKDNQLVPMCIEHSNHSIANRGGVLIAVHKEKTS